MKEDLEHHVVYARSKMEDGNTQASTPEQSLRTTPMELAALPVRPLISILIPNYNYEKYLARAISSVLDQTYDHWEAIVCDDGSTDGSQAILEHYAACDSRIRWVRQANAGVGAALDAAYGLSSGDLICLLDADDYFEPDKLERVLARAKKSPDSGFIQHAMQIVDAGGKVLRRLPKAGDYEEGWIRDRLLQRGGRWRNMPASAITMRREVAELLFPMPGGLRSMVDAYLYMLAPLLTEVAVIDEILAAYRLHDVNLTGSITLGPEISEKYLIGFEKIFDAIGERTKILALPDLDRENHLTCAEHRYMKDAFDGVEQATLRGQNRELQRRIKQDDLYSIGRKWLGRVTFQVLPFLPTRLRTAWVNATLGGLGLRRLVRK